MGYDQTVAEIFFHLAKKHPEFLARLTAVESAFADFEHELGFRVTSYYAKNSSCELAALCDKYGSDKGEIKPYGHPYPWPSHSYTDFYARLWSHCRHSVTKVFECGLGTNNPNLQSSMGALGKPGASLRAWRDYFPNAMVYGADVDKDVLFSEERIETYYIDQLNPDIIKKFWEEIAEDNFDFIIDDGLHTFEAGSCLFLHSIDKLSPMGIYVIEDVNQTDLRRYKDFFRTKDFLVDYVTMYRPHLALNDNNLVAVRRR